VSSSPIPHPIREAISARRLDFAVSVIELVNKLPHTDIGNHIRIQLLKSGTSPGANYEEACGAESRSDFIHKLGVVLKELKESRFWLRVIKKADLLPVDQLDPILKECEELCAIVASSIFTAKKGKSTKKARK
jgi:four helix bundle protein